MSRALAMRDSGIPCLWKCMQQDLLLQKSRLREADAAIALLKETKDKTAAEYRRATYDALAKAEQKVASSAQEVVKADRRTKLQRLTAPVDGVVQQLAVHTVGGVVTPAQALAVLVPSESQLEIEAMRPTADSNAASSCSRRMAAGSFVFTCRIRLCTLALDGRRALALGEVRSFL